MFTPITVNQPAEAPINKPTAETLGDPAAATAGGGSGWEQIPCILGTISKDTQGDSDELHGASRRRVLCDRICLCPEESPWPVGGCGGEARQEKASEKLPTTSEEKAQKGATSLRPPTERTLFGDWFLLRGKLSSTEKTFTSEKSKPILLSIAG